MSNNMTKDAIADAMNLTPLVPSIKEIKPIQSEEDFIAAKGNVQIALETAMTALAQVSNIAKQSEDAKAYRVLNEILQTVIAAAKTQMELKQMDVDVKIKEASQAGPQTVNQNLFIGSTQDLVDMLKKVKEKESN